MAGSSVLQNSNISSKNRKFCWENRRNTEDVHPSVVPLISNLFLFHFKPWQSFVNTHGTIQYTQYGSVWFCLVLYGMIRYSVMRFDGTLSWTRILCTHIQRVEIIKLHIQNQNPDDTCWASSSDLHTSIIVTASVTATASEVTVGEVCSFT